MKHNGRHTRRFVAEHEKLNGNETIKFFYNGKFLGSCNRPDCIECEKLHELMRTDDELGQMILDYMNSLGDPLFDSDDIADIDIDELYDTFTRELEYDYMDYDELSVDLGSNENRLEIFTGEVSQGALDEQEFNESRKITMTLRQLKKMVKENCGRRRHVNEWDDSFAHKFKDDEEDEECFGDGILHVFDYGEDCPFAERYVVMFPSGETLMTSASGSVSYWSEGNYSYSTRQEMEDSVFAIEWSENGKVTECIPQEVDDLSSLPDSLKRLIRNVAGDTGYDLDKEEVERFLVSERRGRRARLATRRRVNEATDFINRSAVREAIFAALNKYGRVIEVKYNDDNDGFLLFTRDGYWKLDMDIKKLDEETLKPIED